MIEKAKNLSGEINTNIVIWSGIAPMMDILDRYGGWPVVKGTSWPSDDWDWLEMNKKILHDGLPDDLILECRIRTDFMNSTKRIIQVK